MSHYKPYPAYKDSGVEWLGRVPEHWDVTRISNHYRLRNGFPFDSASFSPDGEEADRLIRIRDLSPSETRIYTSEPCPESARIQDGDVLVGMDGDFNAVLWQAGPAKLNQRVCALRGETEYLTKFLLYSLPFPLRISNDTAYSTTVKHLSSGEVLGTRIALPPPCELRSIVSHLDSETARIDALVAKKTRFIELLREKRQALITYAVTKGLDPNVKMKDSGVEWLGEVPEHWGVKPLKLLVKEGSTISYGIVQPGEPLDEGVPFVQTTNMSSGDFNIENLQKTTAEIAIAFPRSRLTGGEVILGIRASIGAAFVVPMHLAGVNLSRGVARIDCSHELSSDFLVAYLSSMAVDGYWQLAKQGSTFNEVSIATVKELLVPVPPSHEQIAIESMLNRVTARLDALLCKTERSIQLLKERRSALITAAVTGQIDLREAV